MNVLLPLRIVIFGMRSKRKWICGQNLTIFVGILINLTPAELLENYYIVVIYSVARQGKKRAVVCEWIWDGLEIKLNIILDRNISSSNKQRKSLARWKEERGESRSICSAQLQTCCYCCGYPSKLNFFVFIFFRLDFINRHEIFNWSTEWGS